MWILLLPIWRLLSPPDFGHGYVCEHGKKGRRGLQFVVAHHADRGSVRQRRANSLLRENVETHKVFWRLRRQTFMVLC